MPSVSTIVFFTILLDVMGLGLIIPIQPFLAEHFGATATVVTLLGSTYAGCQFLFTPMWGALSDRLGRRPILLASICLAALGHLAFAFSTSLTALFLARALSGLGAANIATAQAVISDTSPLNSRSKNMALIGAAFGVGFVIGPALGGILSQWDPRFPPLFAAMLATVNFLLVWRLLPETRTARSDAPALHIKSLLSLPSELRPLIGTTFLTMTAFAIMEHTIGLYIESRWVSGADPDRLATATKLTSNFLVVVGVTAVFVQGYFVRKLLPTVGDSKIAFLGLLLLSTALLSIPLLGGIGNYSIFLISGALLAFGSGFFNPAMAGMVSRVAADDEQGARLAANQSAAALGRVIGPVFSGWLFAQAVYLPFVAGSVLVAVAACAFLRGARRASPHYTNAEQTVSAV